jgi:hypothetical protein
VGTTQPINQEARPPPLQVFLTQCWV